MDLSRSATTTRGIVAATLLVASLAGCSAGSGSRSGSDQPGVPAPSLSAAPGAAPSAAKVSINSSSDKDLSAALRASGVDDPEQWARRVGAVRPYPEDDPNLNRLRQDLARYNPDPDTLNKITSILRP
jgi:hypothetical protein